MMETKEKQNGILEGVIWKQLLIFFFPILIGTFFQQLYNTVDTVIVGQFAGKEALSSVGGSSAQIINMASWRNCLPITVLLCLCGFVLQEKREFTVSKK